MNNKQNILHNFIPESQEYDIYRLYINDPKGIDPCQTFGQRAYLKSKDLTNIDKIYNK